jgi:hypothetical protein
MMDTLEQTVKKASSNLKDTDRAKERYEEVVNLVRFGKSKLNIFDRKRILRRDN